MTGRNGFNYLLYFANEHLDFRFAELLSIIDYFKITATVQEGNPKSPFVHIQLKTEEDAKKIASRSVLVKSIFECWKTANSLKNLYTGLTQLPKDLINPYLSSKESFRFHVSAFNKKLKKDEIIQVIEGVPLDFNGPVDLKNPSQSYHILLDYGMQEVLTPTEPEAVYFGRWIADGQRDRIQEYHLKKRKFIGYRRKQPVSWVENCALCEKKLEEHMDRCTNRLANTSMDAQLSMIIANIAKIGPDMWVHDPFVGSGGLLVAAAHFGAFVSGTDIDYLLLHARSAPSRKDQVQREKDESVQANLKQYGSENLYLDVMVADASKQGLWREQTLFDAIITDPPYGVREGAKRTALDQACDGQRQERKIDTSDHTSKKEQYHLSDMFKDLLNFSAKHLHKHGRLLYWFPVVRKDYTDENIPTHPCFKLLYNCEQIINTRVSRRLIAMEKIHDLENCDTDAEMKVDHFGTETFRKRYFKGDAGPEECRTLADGKDKLNNTLSDMKNLQVDDT